MSNKTKMRKIGNSSGVMIPKEIIEALNIHLGEELNLTVEGDALIITKVQSLTELLDTVPKDLKPEEFETGDDIGLEDIEE